jgi:hypothetical protein
MKGTFAILSVAAGLSVLCQTALAQQTDSLTAQASAVSRPDAWRYVYDNNTWWYYHPNNTWSNWNGSSWIPYPYTTGYRSNSLDGTGTAPVGGTGNLSAAEAMPGRSNPQMSGGGMGVNGSAVGADGRNGGTPNLGGGAASRGGNVGRSLSGVDALPGRSNPQMSGGGIGIYGSSVGNPYEGPGNYLYGGGAGGISAVEALPGEANPQMVGGGLGHYGR